MATASGGFMSGRRHAFSDRMDTSIDAVVIGAGPAGSLCSIFLARAGLRVVLAGASNCSHSRPAEILAPPVLRALRSVDKDFPWRMEAAAPCRGVLSTWSERQPGFYDYELCAGETALAIDRRHFDEQLVQLAQREGVEVRLGARASLDVKAGDQSVVTQAESDGGMKIWRCRFVIQATGRRNSLSIPERRPPIFRDQLIAFATEAKSPPRESNLLLLDVSEAGWWYVSDCGVGPVRLVFLTDADLAPATAEARQAWLRQQYRQADLLQAQMKRPPDFRLSRGIDARSWRGPISLPGSSAAVGDAAWSNDPLSGKGIEMAIQTARRAAEAVSQYLQAQDVSQLQRYADWCQVQSTLMWRSRAAVYAAAQPRLRKHTFWRRRVFVPDLLARV